MVLDLTDSGLRTRSNMLLKMFSSSVLVQAYKVCRLGSPTRFSGFLSLPHAPSGTGLWPRKMTGLLSLTSMIHNVYNN